MMGADLIKMSGRGDECAALVDKCKHEVSETCVNILTSHQAWPARVPMDWG